MCSDRQNIGRLSKQLIHPGTFYTQRDCQFNVIIINGRLSTAQMNENILRCTVVNDRIIVVRYSSAVRRLFVRLAGAVGRQSTLHKENSGFAAPTPGRHVSWLSDFIFYPKPLYKSLHQSFFYSLITILPTESGVTLDYCTIFPYTLSFRQQLICSVCCSHNPFFSLDDID